MKKSTALLLASLMCFAAICANACNISSTTEKQSWLQVVNSYENNKQSYIGAHGQPSTTAASYATAKEMGLDFLFLTDDRSPLAFEMADQAGLKTIVSMKNTLYTYTGVDWRNDWSQYPINIAVDYFDEPDVNYFERIAGWVDLHNEKYVESKGANPLFWVNLLPLDTPDTGLSQGDDGLAVDETYINRYCRQVMSKIAGEPILSFDYYPLQARYKSGAVFDYNYVATGWLRSLELVAKYAKQYGVNSHAYIQTCGFYEPNPNANSWICRRVSEEDLRFQVYVSMAYGIRNFTHFTYTTSTIKGYTQSCIDKNGEKTELWYQAQAVNNEVHELDHVFLSFDWMGTSSIIGTENLHIDSEYRNAAFDRLEYGVDEFYGVTGVRATQDTIAGQFYDSENDRYALMLVNYTEPTDEKTNTVTVDVSEGARTSAVYKLGEWNEYSVTNGSVTLQLAPGEGAFVLII